MVGTQRNIDGYELDSSSVYDFLNENPAIMNRLPWIYDSIYQQFGKPRSSILKMSEGDLHVIFELDSDSMDAEEFVMGLEEKLEEECFEQLFIQIKPYYKNQPQ